MKIFAYNLQIQFSVKNASQNYHFPVLKWAEFMAQIESKTPFEGQVFYLWENDAQMMPAQLLAFQSTEKWRNLPFLIHFLFSDEEEKQAFEETFLAFFKGKDAAGGLVQNEENAYLFIFNREKWTFPKGHIEKGEEAAVAALREVQEETGLKTLEMGEKLATTYHTFFKNKWKMKITHWYRMKASSMEALEPQIEEYITDVRWISMKEWGESTWETYPLVEEMMQKEMQKNLIINA